MTGSRAAECRWRRPVRTIIITRTTTMRERGAIARMRPMAGISATPAMGLISSCPHTEEVGRSPRATSVATAQILAVVGSTGPS